MTHTDDPGARTPTRVRTPPARLEGRYSLWRGRREGLTARCGVSRARAQAAPRPGYRVVIGGGRHGLATAFHLATGHGITAVAVREEGPLGLGNVGGHTTLIRSDHFHPDNIRFCESTRPCGS